MSEFSDHDALPYVEGSLIRRNTSLALLPLDALIKTGDVDHADWNHSRLIGALARRRFELVRSLLPKQRVARLLEVGYGSGIFFPELAKHADQLYGIDPHRHASDVERVLRSAGIEATLRQGIAESIPFDDAFFDVVVCVSSLEFVSDLHQVARELGRVLRPAGSIIIVTPANHPLYDLGLRVVTGRSAKEDFGERRNALLDTLRADLIITEQRTFPPSQVPLIPPLYTAIRAVPHRA